MTLAALNRDRLSIYLKKNSIVFKCWMVCFDWFTKNLRHSKACLTYFVKISLRTSLSNCSFSALPFYALASQMPCGSLMVSILLVFDVWGSVGSPSPLCWFIPVLMLECAQLELSLNKYISLKKNEINKSTFLFLSWR